MFFFSKDRDPLTDATGTGNESGKVSFQPNASGGKVIPEAEKAKGKLNCDGQEKDEWMPLVAHLAKALIELVKKPFTNDVT